MQEKIVYKKIGELKLNDRNPRKNDRAVKEVAKSIKKYGFKNPIICDADGIVYCGNTRLKASIELGLEEVPCIVANDLTKKQIKEYALLDNKLNEIAEWDMDMLAEDFDELDLSEFDLDWGFHEAEIDYETGLNGVEKHLLKCPVCGHINEEKAFKYDENTDQDL